MDDRVAELLLRDRPTQDVQLRWSSVGEAWETPVKSTDDSVKSCSVIEGKVRVFRFDGGRGTQSGASMSNNVT